MMGTCRPHHDAICITMPRMRTTIDLPNDLHRIATSISRDEGITLSEAVARVMRRGLAPSGDVTLEPDADGLQLVRLGRTITSDDVRALEDDD